MHFKCTKLNPRPEWSTCKVCFRQLIWMVQEPSWWKGKFLLHVSGNFNVKRKATFSGAEALASGAVGQVCLPAWNPGLSIFSWNWSTHEYFLKTLSRVHHNNAGSHPKYLQMASGEQLCFLTLAGALQAHNFQSPESLESQTEVLKKSSSKKQPLYS